MFREIDRPGIAMLLVPCARPDPIQPPVTKVRGACGTFPRPPPIPPGTLITSGWPAVFSRRCRWALPRPDRVYYSHDGAGEEIEPYHTNAISMLFNQGHETMEGGSERRRLDVVAQSMRAYLRFSVHGGVIAEHVRRLGCSARVQTDLEGDVLQPPLLTLAGLGEVSRIGDVILDPCLGPRRNSGAMRPGSNCPFQESESSSRPSPRGPPRCGRDNRYAG